MHTSSTVTIQKIEAELYGRAVTMWGAERAKVLQPELRTLAYSIATVRANLPGREAQPAFFISDVE